MSYITLLTITTILRTCGLRAWGILSRESPTPWTLLVHVHPGIAVQSDGSHMIVPAAPPLTFLCALIVFWVSQAIDVAAVTGCSITVRRAPWWHNTMWRIPSSSNPLQRRQRVKAKMVYIQHIFPTLFPYSVFTLLCQKCSLWNSNFVVDLPLNS